MTAPPDLMGLHRQAMRLYGKAEALCLAKAGDAPAAETLDAAARADEIRALYLAALEKERAAARYLLDKPENEPSRAIFFKGAAVIAFKAGEYEEAERLLYQGLSGKPPPGFADEMRELLFQLLARRFGAAQRKAS